MDTRCIRGIRAQQTLSRCLLNKGMKTLNWYLENKTKTNMKSDLPDFVGSIGFQFTFFFLLFKCSKEKNSQVFFGWFILLSVSAISGPIIMLRGALKCSKPQGCPRPSRKALTKTQAAEDINNVMSTQSALRNLQEKNTEITLDPGYTALFENALLQKGSKRFTRAMKKRI